MTNPNPNPNPTPPPPPPPVSSPLPSKEQVGTEPDTEPEAAGADAEKVEEVTGEVDKSVVTGEQGDQQMEEPVGGGGGEDGSGQHSSPATVFRIRLKQPPSGLRHKMRVPELCRNFSAVAWCAKLNAIACASETCARIPSSNASPPFWIPIHVLNPERPTECAVFNVRADSPRDFVQFIEWSPWSCPRALLVANFHGRITIWTQPSQGPVNLVRDASTWQCEHEWRQDLAVVTKWLSGMSPYRWLPSNSSNPPDPKTFETRFLQQHSQTTSVKWPNMLCICSVFSSGSVQLHWAQWPSQNGTPPRWFSTSKGLLGAGPSGIMAADAIITESGSLHVAGVPLVNPSTVVVWEVMAGAGNGFQTIPKVTVNGSVSPSLNPPSWTGFAPLAAYLFSLQEYLSTVSSDTIQGKKQGDDEADESVSIHCSPVSNFSAYVSPEAAAQSSTTTTWGSGVTAIAFDPTRAGFVISVVIVEGQYMSPYDPDEGPSITGWRVQCWASSLKPVVLHPIFGNPSSSTFGGQSQTPMQTVWLMRVNKSIAPTDDLRNPQSYIPPTVSLDQTNSSDCSVERANRLSFDPYDLPNDVRQLAQIVYSPHASEVAVAFLRGGVHMFSGLGFNQVDSYHVNVGTAIATPAFSSSGCCLASVWHDTVKDRMILKIIRVLPPAVSQEKVSSAMWERAIADRFWWSLLADVDWWDAVGCTQSAAEDGIVSLNSVIAVLDADFHALPTVQHRQHHSPNLDRIKCRLLEGTNAQDVRALVLDMQARLLLDMLGKGIEAAMVNPSNMLPEPWQATGEMLSGIESDKMIVEQALVPSIQAYVDAVLDLASHFITRLRRYASFCRTLASHAVGASSGPNSARSIVSSPPQSNNNINNINNNNNNNSNNNTHAQPTTNQAQNGSATGPASGSASQMQEWVQGAIAKISNNNDSSSPATSANTVSGGTRSSSFMPISINTGTFPGTPAVRLIGDCHFLHRLCQLLLFCLIFRRRQAPRLLPGRGDKILDPGLQKGILGNAKVEMKIEEGTGPRGLLGPKTLEEGSKMTRLGSGNAGQGYTSDEVKVLFLILVDLCRRTNQLQHPLPASQVGTSNIIIRLHYIDGNYTVLPEVVEASLGPHMQNMPRPRGADAAGLLLRELELHPPAEEWHRRNMFGGPWSDPDDMGPLDNNNNLERLKVGGDSMEMDLNDYCSGVQALWPRKRRLSERDAAFGLRTSMGLGSYIGIMGSRRDVIMAVWKTGLDGVWYKCVRCLRQTCAFAQPRGEGNATNEREAWFISRWIHGCPMCGGTWVKVV